jgi:hypothetical protein
MTWSVGIGALDLVSSAIVIFSALRLNSHPLEHTKWGTIILVFSIIGLGSMFGLFGGALALAYKPKPPPPRFKCDYCGAILKSQFLKCPYCDAPQQQINPI